MTTDIAMSSPPLTAGWLGLRAVARDATLLLRHATTTDGDRLRQLFDRCTPATRYTRFHAALASLPAPYLRQVLSEEPDVHDALVVQVVGPQRRSGRLVAIGSVARLPRGSAGESVAELAVLVEDAWQSRGLGTWLVDVLGGRAGKRGVQRVRGHVLAEGGSRLVRLLGRLGPVVVEYDGPTLTGEATLSSSAYGAARRTGAATVTGS